MQVLIDTGIWYALFDKEDSCRSKLENKRIPFDTHKIIIPWPTLYETLRTAFVKNTLALGLFEKFLEKPNIERLKDINYQEAALKLSFDSSLRGNRPLSMVDCLLRLILADGNVKIQGFATFNMRDFSDVCRKQNIEIF